MSNEPSPLHGTFEALDLLGRAVLIEFAQHPLPLRDTIIRNCVARCLQTNRSIRLLWEQEAYQDGWTLYRVLIDRFFHLVHLVKTDSFEAFEAWSYLEQYKAILRVRSDTQLNDEQRKEGLALVKDESHIRGRKLLKDPPKWSRPRAETVAKDLGMEFLYRFGYDFASTHVHAMANDGEEDFQLLLGLQRGPEYPDHVVLLRNSSLTVTLVLQEAINGSSLRWRALLWDLLDAIRKSIPSDGDQRVLEMGKLVSMMQQRMPLAE